MKVAITHDVPVTRTRAGIMFGQAPTVGRTYVLEARTAVWKRSRWEIGKRVGEAEGLERYMWGKTFRLSMQEWGIEERFKKIVNMTGCVNR